jgi:DNA-binding response OmpR family regulator
MARIVVVEDEADIAMLVTTKFRNAGHQVELARDGEEGLALVLSSQPEVALLDVMMPKMDGYALCKAVRETLGAQAPIIVLLSARSQAIDRQRGFDAGCDEYITKPFRPAELLARVGELMSDRGIT